jgi:Leucine-rich repeat (LRR) protein
MQASHAALAAGIGALTNLRELRVAGNRLAGLSPEVGALRKLHRLVADNNALTSLPGARTPPCILRLIFHSSKARPATGCVHPACGAVSNVPVDHAVHAQSTGSAPRAACTMCSVIFCTAHAHLALVNLLHAFLRRTWALRSTASCIRLPSGLPLAGACEQSEEFQAMMSASTMAV